MSTYTSRITIQTTGRTDILDITSPVAEQLNNAAVHDGTILLFIPGSTAALTTIEFESGAVDDLREAVGRIAPEDIPYRHDRRWGDGNGYAHVRAALLGPSLQIPVMGGGMILGTWQQIVLMDFDNRPRQRRVVVRITGD